MSDSGILARTQQALAKYKLPDATQKIGSVTLDEYHELIAILSYHELQYYQQDEPQIADSEYDLLYKHLEAIESAHPHMQRRDSPTQRIGSDLTTNLDAVKHLMPMLSLANSYNLADLQEWESSVRNYLQLDPEAELAFAVEPKYDGGSVALVYEDNLLVRGATRGNGSEGEDITNNVRTLATVPLSADFSALGIVKAELRGEALIRKDRFAQINEQREADGEAVFANPRNAATGALRMKNPAETAARKLDVFTYSFGYGVDASAADRVEALGSHFASIEKLGELGFLVPGEHMKRCTTIEAVAGFCESMETQRPSLPYELDGMVVKIDDLSLQARLGNTSHHPRWAIAYKFAAQQATSVLERIDYQVGKNGSITPVARITPVTLAGVTVSNVSLHNEDFIRDKDIREGDHLLIERAGDVIPYVVKSLPDYRDGQQQPVEWPSVCPECADPITRPEGEARWLCINPDCPAQVMARLKHHVSKHAMDIDGLGEKQLERFRENGWINSLADIYRLPYQEILALEGFKKKSVEKLSAAIDEAKERPIYRLLVGLSIHHVGQKASKMLAEQLEDLRDLGDWPQEQFVSIHGMGTTVADNIIAWFALNDNRKLLETLASLGVNMQQTQEDKPVLVDDSSVFYNKTILFTGTLSQLGRKEAQGLAEAAGARNTSAVSGKLDILVAGEKAGSKLKKAQALGTVKILTEDEFLALVR